MNGILKRRITVSKEIDLGPVAGRFENFYLTKNEWDSIQKKLKALEIIKKKEVDIYGIKNSIDVYDYNAGIENENDFENRLLTQDEYDLLKEVLL